MTMGSFLLATLSIAVPFFETPCNQGKIKQPRITVTSVYFASYDSVC